MQNEKDAFLVFFGFLISAIITFYSWLALRLGFEDAMWISVISAAVSLLILLGRGLHVPRAWCCSALQILALSETVHWALLTGTLSSPVLGWLILIPVPALFVIGRRAAVFWMALSVLLSVGAYYVALNGLAPPSLLPAATLPHWQFSMIVVICVTQIMLLYLYDATRDSAFSRIGQKNRQLIETRSALLEAQKQKDQFVASVSHELRTPMNAILGFADILADSPLIDPDADRMVSGIRKSADHLLTVINDLLDFSQIQSGRLTIVKEPFDLIDTLETAYTLLKSRAEAKRIRYHIEIAPDLPRWVEGDRHRLTQVLVNLVGNAVKFTPEGSVEISARCGRADEQTGNRQIRIDVSDTGIGIPEDRQAAIFEHFTQADAGIARSYGGNGLGLAISSHLVEQLGGTISLTSEPGVGSTFTVEISLPPAEAPAPKKTAAMQPHTDSTTQLRVLIVDDNMINRTVAAMQLKKRLPHVELAEAEDGVQAVAMLQDGGFDVVLMDMLMPNMDGEEATRVIRNTLPAPQNMVPIIALTANTNPIDLQRCLEAGMNDHMLKPFDKDVLIQKVLLYAFQARPQATDHSTTLFEAELSVSHAHSPSTMLH